MSTLILTARKCTFCMRKYMLGPSERAMIEKNSNFAPVHSACLADWKRLTPAERIARYQREELQAQTKWT